MLLFEKHKDHTRRKPTPKESLKTLLLKMSSWSTIPSKALRQPTPFQVSIPEEQLSDIHKLLELSKIPPVTYESVQGDRKYGITHQWMTEAKQYWLNTFKWYILTRTLTSMRRPGLRANETAGESARNTWTAFRTSNFPLKTAIWTQPSIFISSRSSPLVPTSFPCCCFMAGLVASSSSCQSYPSSRLSTHLGPCLITWSYRPLHA